MIETITFYDLKTGVVLSSGTTCEPESICPEGAGILKDVLAKPFYDRVVDGEVVHRVELPVVLSGNTLIGVPDGAQLKIDTDTYMADGSDITLTFDHPGTYILSVSLWPYLDWSTKIEYST
jgi:hypothetical protein